MEITSIDKVLIGDYTCYPQDYFNLTWLVQGFKDPFAKDQWEVLPFNVFMDWTRAFRERFENKGCLIIDINPGNESFVALYLHDDVYGVVRLTPKKQGENNCWFTRKDKVTV